jgi:hypothetical protein
VIFSPRDWLIRQGYIRGFTSTELAYQRGVDAMRESAETQLRLREQQAQAFDSALAAYDAERERFIAAMEAIAHAKTLEKAKKAARDWARNANATTKRHTTTGGAADVLDD